MAELPVYSEIKGTAQEKRNFIVNYIDDGDVDAGFPDEANKIGGAGRLSDEINENPVYTKTDNDVKLLVDHTRFERWRRARLLAKGLPYTYSTFKNYRDLNIIVSGPVVGLKTMATRIKEGRNVLDGMAATPLTVVVDGRASPINSTIGGVRQVAWPQKQGETDEAIAKSTTMATDVYGRVKIFLGQFLTWTLQPDSAFEISTFEPTATGERAAPQEKTTESSSTKRPVVVTTPTTPTPKPTAVKPLQPPTTTATVTKEAYDAKVAELAELEAQFALVAKRVSTDRVTIEKMAATEQTLRTGISELEARIEENAKTYNAGLKQRESEYVDAMKEYREEVGRAGTTAQQKMINDLGARIDTLEAIGVLKVEIDTKKGTVKDIDDGMTLGDFGTGPGQTAVPIFLYDTPSVALLKTNYLAGGGTTKQILKAELVEQDKLGRLAAGQLGSERVLATFSDSEGRVTNTMELSRLAPKQTEDLRRYLIADLRSESGQPVKQGLGRRDQIPRDGRVSLQVYDRGGLVKEQAFRYGGGEGGGLHAQSVSESNGARLYTTGLSYVTARPDMLVIPY